MEIKLREFGMKIDGNIKCVMVIVDYTGNASILLGDIKLTLPGTLTFQWTENPCITLNCDTYNYETRIVSVPKEMIILLRYRESNSTAFEDNDEKTVPEKRD